ncbi:beta-glucuronidase [Niastella yeongjuensis]|uniref:beta-galactosidase n=1 Tax=Niastella yeongjuensis TaxID=354355 RepID=A0A1V9DXY3_9BACT|nr:sugar-binding domain-containing protein [Niastella yeongjuensis]OQP38738.1 beta-glucuronidase [Niastella yeongjuensis]SEO34470.1 Glycosyl hydrolases family 2 [Niastella yeongjuensis]
MRLTLFIIIFFCSNLVSAQPLSLAGNWQFQIDRNDVGVQEQWFNKKLGDNIKLPGSMLTNGKGDDVTLQTKWTGSIYDSSWFFNPRMEKYRQPGNLKFPFWLTPAKYYVGAAWYQKEVTIPASWTNQHIELFLERCHTETLVWVDGKEAGMQNSLVAPHVYDLTTLLSPGKHVISVRVDNRIKAINVGPDSHSITDHTEGNWNGIIGKMELKAAPVVHVENMQVYPDVANKQAIVIVTLKGQQEGKATITLGATAFNTKIPHQVPAVSASIALNKDTLTTHQFMVPMTDEVQLWDEFNPALYKLQLTLQTPNGEKELKEITFGMRSFKIVGTGFTINDRPVFLRGTVNNCEFPLTGFPPMDEAGWVKLFTTAKAHGLNHMRFHSWCPPEAAFKAADLTGFYLQPEGPGWVNHGTSLGDGKPIDKYMYEETNRMADWYGNYASFCMEAPGGNEPAGRNQVKFLTEMIHYWQAKDKRRVYTGASVGNSWPLVPENEYMVKAGARGLNWVNAAPESDSDYSAGIQKFNVPYVVHEMGQWCVFPDFNEIDRFTGVYKEKNFELFREQLAEHGMANQANQFLMASGKLQVLCYKNEIEKAFRTKGLAGIQLLGLQDFPGQGTALVGMLNALWQDKPYITPQQVKRFCNAVVPLTRMPKFVYSNDEKLTARVELFNYGRSELKNAVINWVIKDSTGKVLANGTFDKKDYVLGNCLPVGTIQYPLSAIKTPMRLNLDISIAGTEYGNDWNVWVFPAVLPAPVWYDDVYSCDTLDKKAMAVLQNGGKVFLKAAGKIRKGKEVVNYFTPVFWNTSWFKMRPPHTLGIVCDPGHPAFKNFPATSYSDLQWWDVVNKAQVMHLEDFPKGFKPLLQPINTWFINRKLGLLLEAKVGKGKLLLCSIDLQHLEDRPATRQLWHSLDIYIHSKAFNPTSTVELSAVQALFTEPSRDTWNGYTKDSPDELKPKVN